MALGQSIGVGMIFSAVDHASNVIKGIGKEFTQLDKQATDLAKSIDATGKFHKLGAEVKGLGPALAVAGVGLAGLAAGFKLADEGGKFEYLMAELGATTKMTAGQVDTLSDTVLKLGAQGKGAPEDLVKVFRELENSSLGAAGAMKALPAVMDLVAASFGKLTAEKAAGLTKKVLESFPEMAGNATAAADLMARAVKNAGVQFEDLPKAIDLVTRAHNTFGASAEDTLSVLGLIKDRMPSTEAAAAGLERVFQRLGSLKTGEKLMGMVDVFDASTGKARPLLDVVGQLAQNMQGLSKAEQMARVEQAFGAKSFEVINPLLEEMNKKAREAGHGTLDFAAAIKQMRADMSDANVTANAMAEAQRNTWMGMKEAIGHSLDSLKTDVGISFNQVLKPVFAFVRQAVTKLVEAFVSLPRPVKNALAGIFLLASASAVIGGLTAAFIALLPVIKVLVLGAVGGFLVVFAKVIAIVAVVTAAIFALRAAWESNFGGIRDAFMPIVDKIMLAFKSLVALFSEGEISGALADDLLDAQNTGVFSFVQGVSRALASLQAFFRGVGQGFSEAMGPIEKMAGPLWTALSQSAMALGRAFINVFAAIGKIFGMNTNATEKGIESMEDFGRVLGSVLGAVAEVATFLATGFAAAINVVASAIETISEYLGGMADLVGGTFRAVIGLITGNVDAALQAITVAINGAFDMVNALIEAAAKAVGIFSDEKAASVRSVKLEHLKPSQVAMALGASDQTIMALHQDEQAKPGSVDTGDAPKQGPPAPGSSVPSSVGSTSAPSTSIPAGEPMGGDRGLGRDEIKALIEESIKAGIASERGKPIIVQADLTMDGQKMATVQAQQSRDSNARAGRLQPWKD